jgi:hypothetical protein
LNLNAKRNVSLFKASRKFGEKVVGKTVVKQQETRRKV